VSLNIFVEVRNALLNVSGVTTIVGSGTAARIWNSWQRTWTTPCLVVDVDEETPEQELDGHGNLTYATVTITARATTHLESDNLSDLVKAFLAGYSGTFDAYFDNLVHSETPKDDGSTDHFYDHVMSFTMSWNEAL
jgi:hypothetical protein